MNTFKKKSLIAALAGASTLIAAGAAQAVAISPEGLGEVLLYPYYTVRSKLDVAPFASLLSVVNSTASAKAVKVRFIEGKASKEVLDFNLFLSAKDVWTAAIIDRPVVSGTEGGAGITTVDNSCTLPPIPPTVTVPFFNYAYVGDPVGDDSLDRTREGYVEIIEMGAIKDGTATWSAVTHSKGTLNVPTCKLGDTATITSQIDGNTGGLFGTMTIINVLAGEDFSVDAVALEGFAPGENLYQPPGDVLPNLASGLPFALNILNDPGSVFGVTGVYSYWGDSIDAVSAVMMRNSVMNEFVLDTSTRSGTDWVVTMPTKRYYYDEVTLANGTTVGEVLNLFQRNLGPNGACDDVELTQYDREERTVSTPQNFSPPPPTPRASICWEANVITFNNSNVFASKNRANFVTAFQNGWVNMAFTGGASGLPQAGVHQLVDNDLQTFVGLPVIGFAAWTFNNGMLTDSAGKLIQSQYGGSYVHKYKTQIDNIF